MLMKTVIKIITTEKDFSDHIYRFYKIFFYSSGKKMKINEHHFFLYEINLIIVKNVISLQKNINFT